MNEEDVQTIAFHMAFITLLLLIIIGCIQFLEPNKEIPSEAYMPTVLGGIVDMKQDIRKESSVIIAQQFEKFEVTAYTAGYESTGKHPDDPWYGVTASGAYVQENHTIACPPSMEFGTEIYIPYFDTVFTCEDRGGAITEGKLDVYMERLSDALEFGRRKLEVEVIR